MSNKEFLPVKQPSFSTAIQRKIHDCNTNVYCRHKQWLRSTEFVAAVQVYKSKMARSFTQNCHVTCLQVVANFRIPSLFKIRWTVFELFTRRQTDMAKLMCTPLYVSVRSRSVGMSRSKLPHSTAELQAVADCVCS